MNGVTAQVVTVLTAIIGLAVVAVLVSRNAQTPQVLQGFWQGFSGALNAATAPVTGSGNGGFNMNNGNMGIGLSGLMNNGI